MSHYEVADDAEVDLDAIWDYIAKDSEEAANRLIQNLVATFESLSELPGQGIRCENLSPGLLRFPTRSYVIYYRRVEDHIRILHVLHGAQRVSRRRFKSS